MTIKLINKVTNIETSIDFITSDQHIGHKNIAKYTGRPFDNEHNTDHMDTTLINNWNSMIGPDDNVLVLGDVALGRIEISLARWGRMQGNKFLVPGNHDRISSIESKSRQERFRPMYEELAGFVILDEVVELDLNGVPAIASHYPYAPDGDFNLDGLAANAFDDRYKDVRPTNNGLPLIHGHTHSRDAFGEQFPNQFHVGVDAHNLFPVAASVIEEFFQV